MKCKRLFISMLAASTLTVASIAHAQTGSRVITVTTTNSTGLAGQTNLTQAIQMLQDGDRIAFNIPGAPETVHYIPTPLGGYPIITNNHVTVDGYSQPGASANSNPIHAANNARIKICLDSRNGYGTSMGQITNFIGVPSRPGFGEDEWAVLGVFGGTNVHLKGLAILSSPTGDDGAGNTGDIKSFSFARSHDRSCADWHVSGCWIGVDPATGQVGYLADGTTVATPTIAIAAYRHRDESGGPLPDVYPEPGTIGVATNSADPRAEFNVFVTGYGFDSEGLNYRISGNFWGVLPDGMSSADMTVLNGGAQAADGFIEIGRNTSNLTIGTDGDGVNDADEGNVFGGFANRGPVMMDLYSDPRTNIVIAGNWFGLAVDGVTRFTNSSVIVDGFGNPATVRFGSDLDGVSDSLEANRVYNNYPPDPAVSTYPAIVALSAGTSLSLRGNSLVNNFTPPLDPTVNGGQLVLDYYAKVVADTNNGVVPILSTNSSVARLSGTVPLPNTNYPVVIVDLYVPDPEGIANGIAANIPEIPDGFIQGKTYLGSFVVDGPGDLNPAAGAFEFDITSLSLPANTKLTATANYSQDPPGTHNGRVVTSLFSKPVAVQTAAQGLVISSVALNASILTITWSGGNPPFQLQTNANLATGSWGNYGASLMGLTATIPVNTAVRQTYVRVVGQ